MGLTVVGVFFVLRRRKAKCVYPDPLSGLFDLDFHSASKTDEIWNEREPPREFDADEAPVETPGRQVSAEELQSHRSA